MGADGTGGRESYPTNDIPNKYIYNTFLNNLFIYFVAAFSLFGTSNDVIMNFVRLQEKAQDNVSSLGRTIDS